MRFAPARHDPDEQSRPERHERVGPDTGRLPRPVAVPTDHSPAIVANTSRSSTSPSVQGTSVIPLPMSPPRRRQLPETEWNSASDRCSRRAQSRRPAPPGRGKWNRASARWPAERRSEDLRLGDTQGNRATPLFASRAGLKTCATGDTQWNRASALFVPVAATRVALYQRAGEGFLDGPRPLVRITFHADDAVPATASAMNAPMAQSNADVFITQRIAVP